MQKQILPIFSNKVRAATLALGLISTAIFSCKKPAIEQPAASGTHMKTMSASIATNDFIFGPDNATTGYRYTKLGRQYGKVFTVENVKNAWNQLSQKQISTLAPTHHYIKFTPQNIEELKAITDANIPVYTFPLDYEILEAGDYMQDPASEPNGIPALYTCLPVDKEIPRASHQVLDELYLLDFRSVVAQKAFELAGEAETYPGLEEGEEAPLALRTAGVNLQDHLNHDLDWGGLYVGDPVITLPGHVPPQPSDNINTVPSTVANACACSLNDDDRKPSGCIKVEETQWFNGNVVFEGVNDVMADFIGPFFQRLSPMTNANGCYNDGRIMRYKIWRPFASPIRLPVIMSAIFISSKKTIKGLNHTGNAFEYSLPMTHCIWSVQGGGLNNVSITYLRDWNVDHNETKYYTCATVNNAIYDYDGYASQDGIQGTMGNLQVLVHKYGGDGAAPMFHKLLVNGSIPTATIAGFVMATAGALPVVGATGAGGMVAMFPPDVVLGYKWDETPQDFTTDNIKWVAYHEFGHVSHYRKAGNSLWENNINYIAHYGLSTPYGNATDPGATRTDLIEMWGYFVGNEYTHRRYGPNRHSRPPAPLFIHSWYGLNEQTRMWFGHIPGGFLQDIRDNNTLNAANGLFEAGGVNDRIQGFSISTIYNQLGSSTTTAQSLIDALQSNIPSGNTVTDYNNLKASYGY